MKIKNILIITAVILTVFCMCSCSRNSNRAIDNAVRRGENAIDRGIGSIGDGIENSMDVITGDRYGANSGYNANAGTGTGTTLPYDGRTTELSPTLRSRARSNMGKVNTNKGSYDYGTR